jgi:hypothetical protein
MKMSRIIKWLLVFALLIAPATAMAVAGNCVFSPTSVQRSGFMQIEAVCTADSAAATWPIIEVPYKLGGKFLFSVNTYFGVTAPTANTDLQILDGQVYTGTHTTGANAAALVDSEAPFPVDGLIYGLVVNVTDVSDGWITDNDATTVTATMGVPTAGTDDDWDVGDVYTITVGRDILNGNGANNIDAATNDHFKPIVNDAAAAAVDTLMPVFSTLYLKITGNSVNSAVTTIVMKFIQ